jgi:hypothetical protein
MDGEWSTHGKDEKCVQNLCQETLREDVGVDGKIKGRH